MKKYHLGVGYVRDCSRRISARRIGRSGLALTVAPQLFIELPIEKQCQRCAKKLRLMSDKAGGE